MSLMKPPTQHVPPVVAHARLQVGASQMTCHGAAAARTLLQTPARNTAEGALNPFHVPALALLRLQTLPLLAAAAVS